MADEAERMVVLKRAYADIILNTAKESAARILAAERRALQLQQSLSFAKEESLDMLLRLKSIMDAKIKEAEKLNSSQARKIQDLEVQLCEAKNTIHHLNSELKKASSKFEIEKSNQTESLGEKSTSGCIISHNGGCQEGRHTSDWAPCSQFGTICPPNSEFNIAVLSQRTAPSHRCFAKYTTQDETSKDLIASDDSAGNPDLASIILRNKEPELCRNGCTQRIRAFEQNLLTGKEPPAQKHDEFSDAKHEAVSCEDGLAERHRVQDPTVVAGAVIQVKEPLESEEVVQQTNNHDNGHMVKFSRRRSSRKRVRKLVMKTTSCSTHHDMGDHEQCDISNSRISGQNSMPRSYEKEGEHNEGTFPSQDSRVSHKTLKNRNMKVNKFSDNITSGTSKTSGVMTRRTMKLCNVNSENHCGGSATSISLNPSQENIKKEPVTASTSETKQSASLVGDVKSTEAQLDKEPMLTTPDQKMSEDSCTSESKENHEMVGVPLTKYGSQDEPCRSSGLPAEVGNDRIVKYTFKRTRKRGSPESKNEAVSLEESNLSKRRADTENSLLEPPKPNLVTESTRDSRRLAQVARQLISLSEKRWW